MSDLFVATAVSLRHDTQYGECSGVIATFGFAATRATLADAEAELGGWVKAHVGSLDEDLVLTIAHVNEYGDQVEAFTYGTAVTIELTRKVEEVSPA